MDEDRNFFGIGGNLVDSMFSRSGTNIDVAEINTADKIGVLTSSELQDQIDIWRNELNNLHMDKACSTMQLTQCAKEYRRVVSLICKGTAEQIRRIKNEYKVGTSEVNHNQGLRRV